LGEVFRDPEQRVSWFLSHLGPQVLGQIEMVAHGSLPAEDLKDAFAETEAHFWERVHGGDVPAEAYLPLALAIARCRAIDAMRAGAPGCAPHKRRRGARHGAVTSCTSPLASKTMSRPA
jgi:hypothetical protein